MDTDRRINDDLEEALRCRQAISADCRGSWMDRAGEKLRRDRPDNRARLSSALSGRSADNGG